MLGMTYQRIKNGYESQAALARKFGVPRQTINDLEKGAIHHSVKWQVKLAELFGVSISELTKEVS